MLYATYICRMRQISPGADEQSTDWEELARRVLKAELPVNTAIATVQGQSFTVNASLVITDQTLRTSGLAATDVFTSNGVIHVVDRVLLPR